MGLFDRLTAKFSPKKSDIGNTEPVCPYCDHQLGKMPGRKKRCPGCDQHMLVRTRPRDRKKILIREDQAILIEEQWSIANGTHDEFLAARREYEAERNRLQKQLGREPTASEIEWAKLTKELGVYAKQYQWGLYRNARLSMGDILKKDKKYKDALDLYLEVCYLDLNGPNNCGSTDPQMLREFPPFNPKDGDLAPGVLGYIDKLLQRQKLGKSDLKVRFLAISANVKNSLGLPVAPEKAWRELSKELN